MVAAKAPLLALRGFGVGFGRDNRALMAVRGVDLTLRPGETMGIVGESGCGKSVLSQSILRLLEHDQSIRYQGHVEFKGLDVMSVPLNEMRRVRGSGIAMVFQDPQSSFDPLCSVGLQISEAIRAHKDVSRKEASRIAVRAMRSVGVDQAESRFKSRPDMFSGGQLQRLMIAMAVALEPEVLIADEPTTALDTTTQADILDLLSSLAEKRKMAMLLISHDLNVVSKVCERVNVMYCGRFVESARVDDLFDSPLHPYTKGLIDAAPSLEGSCPSRLAAIPGSVPPLEDLPTGCSFSPRCPYSDARCERFAPPLSSTRKAEDSHLVACWHCCEGGR